MNFIFDVDGTLWDTTEIVAVAWNDSLEEVGLGESLGRFVTADMLKKEFGKPMDEIIDDLFPGQDQEIKERLQDVIKIHEQKQVSQCTDDLAFAGVKDTLRKLAVSSGLYIVSNCQEGYIPLVTDKLGITDIISDQECFGATGLDKSENIRLLVLRNNLEPHDTFYVGDTYGDYEAATEAGVPFVFASYGFGGDSPVEGYSGRTIASFDKLLELA